MLSWWPGKKSSKPAFSTLSPNFGKLASTSWLRTERKLSSWLVCPTTWQLLLTLRSLSRKKNAKGEGGSFLLWPTTRCFPWRKKGCREEPLFTILTICCSGIRSWGSRLVKPGLRATSAATMGSLTHCHTETRRFSLGLMKRQQRWRTMKSTN